ncbi:1-acyl-sn-glycerol-3-phosphate acyltransferase [Candidatus Saccharibacteria bacterium]|nr:1-acyl-sn-glycerol-3-phosphate acyltransferase [Candidatus Saccharibacteria bacterium]
MIIGGDKSAVIEHIKELAAAGEYNHKAELDDPSLDEEQAAQAITRYQADRAKKIRFFFRSRPAYLLHDIAIMLHKSRTKIVGLEKLADIQGGAIITSNHFNPIDSIFPRLVIQQVFRKFPWIVSQETNLAMDGINGYLMNNLPILPLKNSPNYIVKTFLPELKRLLAAGEFILIYPEEELWFNYRKPRPSKRGTFLFASQANVPVIPCFVEMQDSGLRDNDQFNKLDYTVHVLDPIYPNPNESHRANSKQMAAKDYAQKIAAYETAYGKKLDYKFSYDDIAGYRPPQT